MEIAFLKDTKTSLENHLKEALNEIALKNEALVDTTNEVKSMEIELSKL